MPTYNRAEQLRNAILGITDQTYADFELLVCDDGSTDKTVDVVRAVDDPRVTLLINDHNLGIPGVLNRLVRHANGDAIIMLHDHDLFAPTLLESMVSVLDAHPSVGFVNPGIAWIDPDGSNREDMLPLPAAVNPGLDVARSMLEDPTFRCPITACALVRREAFESVGFYFDERFGFVSDVDLWLRLAMTNDVGQASGVTLLCRRRAPGHAYSSTDWQMIDWLLAIHDENLRRFESLSSASMKIRPGTRERVVRHLILEGIVGAAANGDVAGVQGGAGAAIRQTDGVERLLARTLARSRGGQRVLIEAARAGNRVRRARRSRRAP